MKSKLLKGMLVAGIALAAQSYASAQVYVTIRPKAPVVVQTARPSPKHVWIEEEWREDGHGYKYAGGHWEAPPREGARWIPGHWVHEHRGEFWVRGHWS